MYRDVTIRSQLPPFRVDGRVSTPSRPCAPPLSHVCFDIVRYFKLTTGRALLYGPGSIHHAHSRIEKIGVTELKDAIEAYKKIARSCMAVPPLP